MTDDRPTDLAFWKILNGHISAMDHPIQFMFGFGVGAYRNVSTSDWTKFKITAVSRLV